MNFNKYFAIFAIVIVCLLGQHAAEAHHHLFGHVGHEVERSLHKVGHKLEHARHEVHKTAKKVQKVVGHIKTAKKVVAAAGAIAGVVAAV
ncbi:hypothetical protein FF38_04932 [Lucilia cuprina]|uniref:Uncharacterized protein n=1 Tax=Lucilia cuprina TaxID=7375 RepID=A0A0L0C005_LUCCU|nr:hypothetical protein CVS40_8849 [Lucilia cuprina]KNC25647.1 hypothetical protein FF38_04932 [Lucilia cuprina]